MMRFWIFGLSVALFLGWLMLSPTLDHLSQEAKSVNTSHSASPHGYRALTEVLGQIHPESRVWDYSVMRLTPQTPRIIWFNEPGVGLFFDKPEYREHLRELVRTGYHFVFVLDPKTLSYKIETAAGKEQSIDVKQYLNDWFDMGLSFTTWEPTEEMETITLQSSTLPRRVNQLVYQKPKLKMSSSDGPELLNKLKKKPPKHPDSIATVLSTRQDVDLMFTALDYGPLVVRKPYGKGSVTVMASGLFLQNAQLDHGDNMAFAAALVESLPSLPLLFETHSNGFSASPDIVTYLARGDGVGLLISSVLLLIALSWRLASRLPRRVKLCADRDDRQITQETFIRTLAGHYRHSGQWPALFQKRVDRLLAVMRRRLPAEDNESLLSAMASNPYYDSDRASLEILLSPPSMSTAQHFLDAVRHVWLIERKVKRYEPDTARRSRGDSRTPTRR